MTNAQNTKKRRGIPINAVTVPIAAVLAVLHVVIIVVIIMVNNVSGSLSGIMETTSQYLSDATLLQAGSSLLSETSSAFVLSPTLPDGSVNTGPLVGFVQELSVPRRGDDIVAMFADRDISDTARAALGTAAENANEMFNVQLHAIALVKSAVPVPDIPPLAGFPEVDLPEEELAMDPDERVALAGRMIIDNVYTQRKQVISESITEAVTDMRSAAYARAAVTGRKLAMLRMLLWATTISIVVLLACFFFVLYSQLVTPLNGFSKLIASNRSLDENKGLREVQVLASAYNALLKRRDALDSILRSAAETDALTNLPNRYRFEQYLLESEEGGYSMAVFLFDINYLKQTNDTLGHLAGDKLIRDAAECISACFDDGPNGCCFRFGGDEFAAILKNCDPASIQARIDRFEAMEREKGISISMGYAYAQDVGDTTFKKLLDEADQKMYARKKAAHMEHDKRK